MIKFELSPVEQVFIPINEGLGVELKTQDPTVMLLHVKDVKSRSIGEKLSMLRNGFEDLAKRLGNTDSLKDVKYIYATSWIVTAKRSLMEKLGLTVDNHFPQALIHLDNYKASTEVLPDIPPSFAYISKEQFLELYG